MTTSSRDISELLEGIQRTKYSDRDRVDPEDVKHAIRLLRAVDSTAMSDHGRHQRMFSSSISDDDPRSHSYSEQRSVILEDFNRRTFRGSSPRSVGVGREHPSITSKRSSASRVESRPRPNVHRTPIQTPDESAETFKPTILKFRNHLQSMDRHVTDLFPEDSYSLVEIYELLVSLDCPRVTEDDIDHLLLHLSADTYWEEGYFMNVSRKSLMEFFS